VTHILVVDDDAAIRNVVADILELSDFQVRTASNGAEALAYLRVERPAAVLLDLMMPVMDGRELLHHIRGEANWASLPVVIMSAARDAPLLADEMDAQAFLPKPFELDNVLELVNQLAPQLSPTR
jgi:chemosensory pili system protein ChpA (sensor histidine kinase/response regulator)